MKLATSVEGKGIVAAWRRLEKGRRAEADLRRAGLQKEQWNVREMLVARVKEVGYARQQQRAALRTLSAELDLIERGQRRDLEDKMQREQREAAEVDSKDGIVSWMDREQALDPTTASELIRRLAADGVEVLASAKARFVAQRIRERGTDAQKRLLAKAFLGIRPGRRKERTEDPSVLRRMRLQKTEIQKALVRLRRAWKRTSVRDASRYAEMIDRELLIPLGLSPEKRRSLLPRISDPAIAPVDTASTIVGTQFHVRPSVVRRLGRATVARKKKRAAHGRPAGKSGRRRRDVFVV